MLVRLVAGLALLSGLGCSHPTVHERVDPMQFEKNGELPPIMSYHMHALYIDDGADSTQRALDFREKFVAHFNVTNDCTSPVLPQPDVCMFEVEESNHDAPTPFISGNWAVYITLERYQEIQWWSMQHREDLDLFFHPNTNAFVHDHARWSTWGGRQWPLNVETLPTYGKTEGEYCNYWGCYFGTSGGSGDDDLI